MCELLKLPILIQHYTEHKQQSSSISFIDFLDIHYMHGSPKDADYDRDMQLPFKSCTHSSLTFAAFIIPAPETFTLRRIAHSARKLKTILSSSDYSYNYLSSIWQPPRAS
jgi:hypothetical protein